MVYESKNNGLKIRKKDNLLIQRSFQRFVVCVLRAVYELREGDGHRTIVLPKIVEEPH